MGRGASLKPYTNKAWLQRQYEKLRKSTPKIAAEIGCSQFVIRKWLKRFEIPVRGLAEAIQLAKSNHVFLTVKAKEFLYGELLSDGHLDHYNRPSSAYSRNSKHESYLKWTSNELTRFGIEQCGKIRRYDSFVKSRSSGKLFSYVDFNYGSRNYIELKDLWEKWYRPATQEEREKDRKFIKIVPKDLKLTPLICRQWYIGDGHSQGGGIFLCTECFSVHEVNFLMDQLIGLGFKGTRTTTNRIYISVRSAPNFLNYVGPCPVKCYEYKWSTKRIS